MKPSPATVEHYGVARQPEHSHAIIACSKEGTKRLHRHHAVVYGILDLSKLNSTALVWHQLTQRLNQVVPPPCYSIVARLGFNRRTVP